MARIGIVGGGVAGLAAALLLVRDRQQVTLYEGDAVATTTPPDGDLSWVAWNRPGVPHGLLPHTFQARSRLLLEAELPDVFETLLAGGAWVPANPPLLTAEPEPGDDELPGLACRRPLFEAALRHWVAAEQSIDHRPGVKVLGLTATEGRTRPRVTGVRADDGGQAFDLVIDASGRRSPVWQWLAEIGADLPEASVVPCDLGYYARNYRLRSGSEYPVPHSMLAPIGESVGYRVAVQKSDTRTFAIIFGIPPGDSELKALRRTEAFEAAVAAIPAVFPWADRGTAEPLGEVHVMGSLQNFVRDFLDDDEPVAEGWLPLGDSWCHTNPGFALGLSLALSQAAALRDCLRIVGTDPTRLAHEFHRRGTRESIERFTYISASDRLRTLIWNEQPADDPDLVTARFVRERLLPALGHSPALTRVWLRMAGLLASPTTIEADAMGAGLEAVPARTTPAPGGFPARSDLVEAIRTSRVASGPN